MSEKILKILRDLNLRRLLKKLSFQIQKVISASENVLYFPGRARCP